MPKIHFTREEYLGLGACQSDDTQDLQVTENIAKVTCRRCLNLVGFTTPSLDELRKKAQHELAKR